MSSNFLNDENKGDIIIYQSESGETKIDVRFQDETVWLTQAQMEELFQSSHANVVEHIKNIYSEGELDESSTCRKFRQVRREGNRNVERERLYYNLDMIISLGYRIRSSIATQFRRWATERLKEYMIKGFAMDDERLKNLGGGSYWKELLDRIRDIRSSEKVMYRQVLDLYATSVDYDPKSAESVAFFKMVQNKLHYAVTGKTAAELLSQRATLDSPTMGLTTWKGAPDRKILKSDTLVAKNYLNQKELSRLNRLVTMFIDYAELMAEDEQLMSMQDWLNETDRFLENNRRKVLDSKGHISREAAAQKVGAIYDEFRKKQDLEYISDFDREMAKYLKGGEPT